MFRLKWQFLSEMCFWQKCVVNYGPLLFLKVLLLCFIGKMFPKIWRYFQMNLDQWSDNFCLINFLLLCVTSQQRIKRGRLVTTCCSFSFWTWSVKAKPSLLRYVPDAAAAAYPSSLADSDTPRWRAGSRSLERSRTSSGSPARMRPSVEPRRAKRTKAVRRNLCSSDKILCCLNLDGPVIWLETKNWTANTWMR